MAVDEPTLKRAAVRFGVFELDLKAGELRRNGSKIKLQEQPFQILRLLLERPGELVTHDEIIQTLWPNGTIVEYEHSVKTAVKKLRQALGDDADTPRYVETLPRRGYRFIYPVDSVRAGLVPAQSPTDAAFTAAGHPQGLALQRRSIWLLALGGALVLVATVLAYFLTRPLPPPRVLGSTQITNDGRSKFAATVGPGNVRPPMLTDGSRLYFLQAVGPVSAIMQVSTAGGESSAVLSSSTESPWPLPLDISPNESELLLVRDGERHDQPLWVLPLPNGPMRRLGEAVGHDATWSPDGTKIVYAKGRDLYLAASNGNETRKLVTAPGRVMWPRWSPNAKTLRFTLEDTATFWEVSANGTNLHPVLPDWKAVCCGNWTPDGKYFVFQSTRRGRTSIWARREAAGPLRKVDTEPRELTTSGLDAFQPVVSRDGKRIFVIGAVSRGEVLRYDSVSRQFVPYLPELSATDLDFSRDGEWVTYVAYPSETLWRSKTDGSERLQLTSPPMRTFLPRWSPDGRRIAFSVVGPGTTSHIYVIPTEGGKPERVTHEWAAESDVSWSADGKTLVFGPPSPGQPLEIHLVDVATGHVTKLAGSEGLFSCRWSPDGKYIAALHDDGYELTLYEVATGKWQEMGQPGAGYPSWSRDSRYIYFIDGIDAFFRLRISDKKLERVVGLKNINRVDAAWIGLGPDDAPMIVREMGTQEIYALDVDFP